MLDALALLKKICGAGPSTSGAPTGSVIQGDQDGNDYQRAVAKTPKVYASVSTANRTNERKRGNNKVEVTKALAALKPLYGQDNVEIITTDGNRVRGIVRSMKTTQALT